MNTSSCSDSSFLASADCGSISSAGSAEAINSELEADDSQNIISQIASEKANNRKNSLSPKQVSPLRHSTPSKSKTGLRFIVAAEDSDSEIDEIDSGENNSSSQQKCETTFSRTTFANNAGYPNCGTFFVKHISDDEITYEDNQHATNGNHFENLVDENENSSSAYASPNSIRKLVHGADKLVFIQTPIDDSDVDYRPQSELSLHRPPKTNRSHSFHATSSKHLYSSDNVVISSAEEDSDHEVGMDCERDSLNPSLKDASSLQGLSQLVDSVVAEVHQSMLNEPISGVSDGDYGIDYDYDDPHTLMSPALVQAFDPNSCAGKNSSNHGVPQIVVEDEQDGVRSTTNEEEEISDFWDQEKYLSEHNYDEPIDVDSTLKLLNFGDDYSKFIDSMSDEFSDLDPATVKPQRTKRKIRRQSTVNQSKGSHYDSMSDSETDDAWRAVLLSRTKLNEVKQRLRNLEEDDQFTKNPVELTILKDVCYENIDCILKLLDESGAENSTVVVLKKTERSFKGLLKQWQEILQMIVKRLQLSEAFGKIMKDVESMESNLESVALPQDNPQQLFHSQQDLENHIQTLKSSIMSLSQQKSDLFHTNVEIHNFLAELSCCPGVSFNTPPSSLGRKDKQQHNQPQHRQPPQLMMTTSEVTEHPEIWLQHHGGYNGQNNGGAGTPLRKETTITKGLKDKVVALYSKWDEAFHKTNTQLVNAQTTYANLLQFEIESKRLGSKSAEPHGASTQVGTGGLAGAGMTKDDQFNGSSSLGSRQQRRKKQDSLSLTEDSGISESCDDTEEAILTKMKLLARDLEQKLSLDSNLAQEIAKTLKTSTSDLEERLQCRAHINRNCMGTQTVMADFENVADCINGGFDFDCDLTTEEEAVFKKSSSSFGWFRRVIKFALPVQFFFVMMMFLAWNATDHHHGYFHGGCDGSSRFQFLYPQLKYINGPPPI